MASCHRRSIGGIKVASHLIFAILLAGCSVQLTAPYDADIDREAGRLQLDFFKFVANMQTIAGTTKGYYSKHEADYSDFEARLAVIRLRSDAVGGVPCARALGPAEQVGEAEITNMDQQLKASLSSRATGGASCITILARMAEEQMDSLRRIHQLVCNHSQPPRECQAVFSSPPLFSIIDTSQSRAPAVSAVSVVLNELVRQEQKLKSDTRS
jgi:hypothetical protein